MSGHSWLPGPIADGLEDIHHSWSWVVVLGLVLIVIGAASLVADATATLATVLVFGWLLLIGALASLVHALQTRARSSFFLHLLSALLRGFTGYLLIRYPRAGEIGLTLILASFFVVGGLFRAVGTAALQFPRWGWAALSGLISASLGVVLLLQLPLTSLWFIGLAIGIDFIFDGVALVAVGLTLRRTA